LQSKLDSANSQLALHGSSDPYALSTVTAKFEELKKTHADCAPRLQIAQKNLATFETERRKFKEQLAAEERARSKVQKEHIEKQESDIARMRQARDTALAHVSLEQSKVAQEFGQIQQLRLIANSRKDRIKALESEVERFKIAIAEGSGDNALLAYFGENVEEGEDEIGNPYTELRERLRSMEGKMAMQQVALDKLPSESRDKEALLEVQHTLELKVSQLEAKLDTDIAAALDKEKEASASLSTKLAASQKTHSHLITEINSMCEALTSLETQVSAKVLKLIDTETSMSRLNLEKAKLDQKCSVLSKQLATISNANSTGKKLIDRQLDRIRGFEDVERGLIAQISSLEKIVFQENSGTAVYKARVDELERQVSESQTKIEKLSAHAAELDRIAKKMAIIEDGERERRKISENCEVLKRKVEGLPPTAEGDLEKQLDDCKRLLKCSSCNIRFKSTCLLKCMHTFCKECIDDMYNSRQRKCPSCGTPFSSHDIKQIFL